MAASNLAVLNTQPITTNTTDLSISKSLTYTETSTQISTNNSSSSVEENSTEVKTKTFNDYLNDIARYGNEIQQNSITARNSRLLLSKDKSNIIEPIVVKSGTTEEIYESESESEEEEEPREVWDLDAIIAKQLKTMHNDYGDSKEYTFEEHNAIIKHFQEVCKFHETLDLTIGAKSLIKDVVENSNNNPDIIKYKKMLRQYHCETLRTAIDNYYEEHNLDAIPLEYIEQRHAYIMPDIELLEIEALMKQFARLENIIEQRGCAIGDRHVSTILYAAYYQRQQTHEYFWESEKIIKCLSAPYYGDNHYLEGVQRQEEVEKQLSRRITEYENDNDLSEIEVQTTGVRDLWI